MTKIVICQRAVQSAKVEFNGGGIFQDHGHEGMRCSSVLQPSWFRMAPLSMFGKHVIADTTPFASDFASKSCQIAYGKPCRAISMSGNYEEDVYRMVGVM
jgi:hypothetical protein